MVNYDRLPVASKHFCGVLYQKMNEDLQLAGMSKRTVHGYLRAVRQLADYCEKTPDQITEADFRRYFLYLKNEKEFAYGSIRVAFSGIKFFYTRTCKRHWETLAHDEAATGQNAPGGPDDRASPQVRRCCPSRANRIVLVDHLQHGTAARRSSQPCKSLTSIRQRMMVHIHRGKGAKDRYVPLPTSTLLWLRQHWTTHRHPRFLFPAEGRNHKQSSVAETPIQTSTVQKAMGKIAA